MLLATSRIPFNSRNKGFKCESMTWRAISGRPDLGARHAVGAEPLGVVPALRQGLTLVHFSAQRKYILWGTLGA